MKIAQQGFLAGAAQKPRLSAKNNVKYLVKIIKFLKYECCVTLKESVSWYFATLPICDVIFARGRGGSGDPKLFFGVVVAFAFSWMLYKTDKSFPALFSAIGGLTLMFLASYWAAVILEMIGLISQDSVLLAMAALFVLMLFSPAIFKILKNLYVKEKDT